MRSALLEVKPKIVRFVHEMRRDDLGDHLATMLVTAIHMDTVARKSTPFEPPILEAAQKLLAANPALWDTWPPKEPRLT